MSKEKKALDPATLVGSLCYFVVCNSVFEGQIVGHKPREHRVQIESFAVEYYDCGVRLKAEFPIGDVTVPIKGKDTPKIWDDIMEKQTLEVQKRIGVCHVFHTSPACTTLFDPKTLERLRSEVGSMEVAEVKLWDGEEAPSESKADLVDCDTMYLVGDISIDMEAEHYV